MAALPDKPSELIILAVDDLEKAEADRRYRIDMGIFHQVDHDGKCAVCLAGAVMAFSLDTPCFSYAGTGDFDPKTSAKLKAIDWFRVGNILMGLRCMGINDSRGYIDVLYDVCFYSENPKMFKQQMRAMAAELKQRGL